MRMSKLIKNTVVTLICLLIADAILFNWVDLPIASYYQQAAHGAYYWFGHNIVPNLFLTRLWGKISLGILLLGIALFFIIKNKMVSRSMVFFAATYLVSFCGTLVFKVLLGRYRPDLYFSQHLYGFHYLATAHDLNSMPSGHATAIFAILMGLARIIHQRIATVVLFILAIICAYTRVVIGAHYPSDVLTGATIALLANYWVAYLMNYRQARAVRR